MKIIDFGTISGNSVSDEERSIQEHIGCFISIWKFSFSITWISREITFMPCRAEYPPISSAVEENW